MSSAKIHPTAIVDPGAEFGFNVAFMDDDDGSGPKYWFQLAPGLCGRNPKTPTPDKSYPRYVFEQ